EGAIEMLRYALLDKEGVMWPTNIITLPMATQTVSQAELDALEGIYVGGGGYDKVVAREGYLDMQMLVGFDGPEVTNITLRTNGWFVSGSANSAVSFTNVAGRQVMLTHQLVEDGTITSHSMRGDLYDPPAIHPAWTARTNELWYVQNEDVYSYMPLSGTTPQIQLSISDGVLMMAGGLTGVKVLVATNDSQAWAYGLHNRVDSCVQVLTNNGNEALLYAGYIFSRVAQMETGSVTGSIDAAGNSGRYEVQLPDAGVAGGVTDVVYEVTLSGAPTNFVLRIYGSDGARLQDERTGDGLLYLQSGGGTHYLYVQPLPDGVQTGRYVLSFDLPVLVRDLSMNDGRISLAWQGETNTTFALESALRLDVTNAFLPDITNIVPAGPLNSITNDIGPDKSRFYRVIEEADNYSNRYGRIVLISDMHMSPFASSFIVGQLLVSDVSSWDVILQSATNGYYTEDATQTGYPPTTPMMYASALTNAYAACPRPDAVIMPGDFVYYYFENFYNQITGDPNTNNWRTLLIKMYEYALLKVNQTYPGVPVYFALGNDDTFLADYDIDVGDAFLAETAPLFHGMGLSNVTDYTSFAATYTNGGNYAAPFVGGELVVLETSFFSSKYPGGMAEASNQLAYLEERLSDCSSQSKPSWILLHIPPGVDGFATWREWRNGNTNTVVSDWKEPLVRQFNQMIADYRDTVKTIICGHYHERSWQMANDPATSNVTVGIQVMNGMLANHGNNSGFTVMTFDRKTLEPIREYSYNLPNSYAGKTGPALWNDRFSMNEGFGIDDLSAASLLSAWSNMALAGSAGYDYYNQQYSGGRQPYLMSSNSWPVYHGLIRWIEEDQFLENVVP
ncbi:MAG: metallophosphoesterase, partial [Kiritimatiellae bacterium]|nr:metallophosphoesterase [Kiritimatiellia bacterium]